MAKCSSCNAPITWIKTVRGRSMPIDPTPCEDGNLILTHAGAMMVSKARAAEYWAAGTSLFSSHFASCAKSRPKRRKVK